MRSAELEIRTVWRGLDGDEATVDDILARHREPHRQYHTVQHVAWVVSTVDELLSAHPVDDAAAVRAAALFHDVVYDPTASDNEARSADVARRALAALGWTDDRCAEVVRLIMTTASHEPDGPDDVRAAVLLDADLGVLGAEAAAYHAYVTGVRAEYSHVNDANWRTGRAAVLRSFLDRDRIYRTATMFDRFELRARANLLAELSELTG